MHLERTPSAHRWWGDLSAACWHIVSVACIFHFHLAFVVPQQFLLSSLSTAWNVQYLVCFYTSRNPQRLFNCYYRCTILAPSKACMNQVTNTRVHPVMLATHMHSKTISKISRGSRSLQVVSSPHAIMHDKMRMRSSLLCLPAAYEC